ncbi:MAG TPA: hypothetical protein VMI56_19115 [Reyranella sp.]|nr:hypothetical protein [Reyranella sp.]
MSKIKMGDIFHAANKQGTTSLICLATSITETTIHARTVTHGLEFMFDRLTGVGKELEYSMSGTIDSVAPLPPDIYDALMSLDLKRQNWDGPLSEEQKRALIFVSYFYPENPID